MTLLRQTLVAIAWLSTASTVFAQDAGLAGYGGSTPMMTGSASPSLPYSGSFSGFMPYRMGGNASLSFSASSRPSGARSPFRLSNMSTSGGMNRKPFSSSSAGMGNGMKAPVGTGRTSVMPPSFGYPFRQPPSLIGSGSTLSGVSM